MRQRDVPSTNIEHRGLRYLVASFIPLSTALPTASEISGQFVCCSRLRWLSQLRGTIASVIMIGLELRPSEFRRPHAYA